MSDFEQQTLNAVKQGLSLEDGMYQHEYIVGRFISGWKHSIDSTDNRVGLRRIDLKINGDNTLYGILRPIYTEAQGTQHEDANAPHHNPTYDKKTKKRRWSRKQKFNDQVDRDEFITIKAAEDNAILILIKEPTYKTYNPAYYEQLDKLIKKLKQPGYLMQLIIKCENANYKGCIITWQDEKFITPKRKWPKVKYYTKDN